VDPVGAADSFRRAMDQGHQLARVEYDKLVHDQAQAHLAKPGTLIPGQVSPVRARPREVGPAAPARESGDREDPPPGANLPLRTPQGKRVGGRTVTRRGPNT
jgi:hypothetical protein